jgi:Baseplate J-like protein
METCSSKISIHQGTGTTQEERFLAALNTDYFLIDERKEIDFIQFAQRLSPFVKFFNDSNVEEKDWASFFQWESTSILVQIYFWDVLSLQEDYKNAKEEVLASTIIADQRTTLINFFNVIRAQYISFNEKITYLDATIVAKEFFEGTRQLILDKIELLETAVNLPANNPSTLITNFQFDKNVQQLFGLLFNWKQVSYESLETQLESYSSNSPHYALFLAFLKLLGVAQDELNGFTKKHLDFYYKDVLKIEPAEAIPDYVHLTTEPAAENTTYLLPKDTILPAGENTLGQKKYYATTADFALNSIKLNSFLSSAVDENTTWKQTNLADYNATDTPFNVFTQNASDVEFGLLIASPLFYLNGGERNILLKVNGSNIDTTQFNFYITGEKKVIPITNFKVNGENYLNIPTSEKKIIAYNTEIHTEIKTNTTFPVLKIIPKSPFTQISINSLEIKVAVYNLKSFVVGTDTGSVDITKPFLPFGDFPKKGNGFVIGCNEFFIKKNAQLTLDISPSFFSSSLQSSISLITEDFISNDISFSINSNDFSIAKVNKSSKNGSIATKIEKLIDGKWSDSKVFSNDFINTNPLTEYQEIDSLPDITSTSGYLKITLNDNAYLNEKFLQNYIAEAKKDSPALPSAPSIDAIFLNYTVSQVYSYNGTSDNVIELYHILPFGYKLNQEITTLFPQNAPDKGEIYLGFENVEIGNGLSMLLQLAEGTANPRQESATIKWYYLSQNTWIEFESSFIGDETNGLTQSGLVQITVPDFDMSTSTILTSSLFWIKITVDKIDAICNFIGVHEQAFKAVLTDFEENGSVFIENTSQKTISKLNEPVASIKKITQPYTSFGGKKQEDDSLLYQRSSERLRHKKRAITSWDYERLILQEFPEVYRVKCLNHYRYDSKTISNVSAGYVTLIPIAKSNDNQNTISWKPLLSLGTLSKIKKMLVAIASPHARILVKTPSLEKIEVKFKVKYREIDGADTRLYSSLLKDVVNQYLSPWAYTNTEINFANSIEISSLIQLIDNQSFVDYITDFEVNQIILNETTDDEKMKFSNVKEIEPKTDFTLFIPNDSHTIDEITTNC